MPMNKKAAKEAMVCFANYLSEWADWYDKAGFFEVADGITHIVDKMCKETSQMESMNKNATEPMNNVDMNDIAEKEG